MSSFRSFLSLTNFLEKTWYAFKLALNKRCPEMTVISDGLICSMLNMIHRKSAACRIVNAIHVFTHLRSREHNSIRVPGNHCELLWTYSVDLSVKPYQTPEQVERIWQIFGAKYSWNTASLTTDFSPDSLQFSIRATFIRENLPPAAWIHRVQFIHLAGL